MSDETKNLLKPEIPSDQTEEIRDLDEDGTDVLVQDYSDMKIEMLHPTRKNFLSWQEFF